MGHPVKVLLFAFNNTAKKTKADKTRFVVALPRLYLFAQVQLVVDLDA